MFQHHVHVKNKDGQRVPLQHCRRADNRKLCKSGLLALMDRVPAGRRNDLGSLHGPMNEPNLNGTHPALLANAE
eukprot:2066497-Karenia_brevis.AAC.1